MIKIETWDKSVTPLGPGTFIEMSRQDALEVIQSLSNQLVSGSVNTGRREWWIGPGRRYFSIGIVEDPK